MPQSIVSQFDRKYGLPIETYRSVQNITQRNNIPDSIRWEGMIVHVIGDQSYILLGGTDDTKWEPLGGLVNVNVVDNLLSTSPTDALSANQGRVLKDLIDNIDTSVNWGEITGLLSNQTDLNTKFNDYQLLSLKGVANGYAPLDSGAKVPIANLPDSVVGQVEYQSTWAASTNTPTLSNPPDSSTKGHYYVCSDNGTQFGISFQTGDWIISNGSAWEKVDNTDAVTSVFGRLGNVVANSGDYAAYYLGISDKAADSELLDGIDSSGFVRTSTDQTISGTKTFTGNRIEVSNGTSVIRLQSTAAALNQKNTYLLGTPTGFQIRNYNDALSGFTTPFSLTRSGTGTTSMSFVSDSSTFSGDVNTGDKLDIFGTTSGSSNFSLLRFMESNGSTTQGLIGRVGQAYLRIQNSVSGQWIQLLDSAGSSGLGFYDGSVLRTVWHEGNDGPTSGMFAEFATKLSTPNWEIVETGGVLQFKYGGVTKFEMNSTGILEGTDFKQGL